MANKSYKQLYEELKEQTRPLTEEELEALRLVAHGCNTNSKLRGYMDYVDALATVYKLIERLEE
jgi:hypothetical protein